MKKTFTTVMPDKVGAFLAASRIFGDLNLNITRVSYNKAVDAHMLFIEAEGEEAALLQAAQALHAIGYLQSSTHQGSVIVIEFRLPDRPGAVQPALELISQFAFNISYISSQSSGGDYQFFRMGLLVENSEDVALFLQRASALCDVNIVDYDQTGVALDNTVFYMSFAGRIAQKNGLGEKDKRALIINANLVMDILTRLGSPPYKTFEYIGQFAERLRLYRGAAYTPRVTEHPLSNGMRATLIEPPCGSNICLIRTDAGLVLIDGGFPCYSAESLACIQSLFPDFDTAPKNLLLTHADVDHCGLAAYCDTVYVSAACYDNFARENAGEDNLRESNSLHAPYVRISKLLSGYQPPDLKRLKVIGHGTGEITWPIGVLHLGGLSLEVHAFAGGHAPGEVVYIERGLRMAFTGDILVNVKGFTKEQAAFNRLAPYLMTSVDTAPALAAQERKALLGLLGSGEWLVFGGHGAAMTLKL